MSDDSTPSDTDDGTVSESRIPETTRRGLLVLVLAAISGAVIWLLDNIIPGPSKLEGYGRGGYGESSYGK